MTTTVLVTGGTGYVAAWCATRLLEQGYEVRTTVRDPAREGAVRAAVTAGLGADPERRLGFAVADLTADAGWDRAVADCAYVLHVASPLGADAPKDPDALLGPARDGALRVLGAALDAGAERVVMTSACAAASPPLGAPDSISDETRWTDTGDPTLTAYRKSKAVAEQAAWRFARDRGAEHRLTTVLPGAVFGPLLHHSHRGSTQIVERLLRGMPGTARIGFEVVDVRDLADLHVRAMTAPEAAGQRFIGAGEFLWMSELAAVLRERLGDAAAKVPARTLPDTAVRLLARVTPGLRALTPYLGRKHLHSSDKAERVLDWRARPAADTLADCARSLVRHPVPRD